MNIANIKKIYFNDSKVKAMNLFKNKFRSSEVLQYFNIKDEIEHISNNKRLMYIYMYLYDIQKIPKCKYCNNDAMFINVTNGFKLICDDKKCKKLNRSNSAKLSWSKKNKKEIVKKTQETNLKKYGAVSNLSKNTESRKNATDKLYEKYNVTHPSHSKVIMDKKMNTFNRKYGGLDIVNNPKTKRTLFEKYGIDNVGKSKEFSKKGGITQSKNKMNELIQRASVIKIKDIKYMDENNKYWLSCTCSECNTKLDYIHRVTLNRAILGKFSICPHCNTDIHKFRSRKESELFKYLNEILPNDNIDVNKKIILNRETDFIIEKYKLAIEFNGLYWHNNLNKPDNYHLEKQLNANNYNYNLIHIWEDDWNHPQKKLIIKSRLKNLFGLSENKIYARKCIIKKIPTDTARNFLNANHLYGYISSKIKLGLFYNDELISVGTFRKPRSFISGNKNKYDWELIRFATILNTNCIGGFGKLISNFKNNYMKDNESLISYVDCDWSNEKSNTYNKIGFKYIKRTVPGYWWIINGIRHHRFNFTRSKIKDIQKHETVDEYMYKKGHYKIWNTGNLFYKLIK